MVIWRWRPFSLHKKGGILTSQESDYKILPVVFGVRTCGNIYESKVANVIFMTEFFGAITFLEHIYIVDNKNEEEDRERVYVYKKEQENTKL